MTTKVFTNVMDEKEEYNLNRKKDEKQGNIKNME
jgi:hypothetical protein